MNVKIGAPPIISARSALVVSRAAAAKSRNGAIWPISDSIASRAHTFAPRGQRPPVSNTQPSNTAVPIATRPSARLNGSNARDAIFTNRNDEPHRAERNASIA
jgi:hypothetical protein